MEIRQCDFCRVPYQSYGSKICGDCLAQLDIDFMTIKDYLYENEGAGIEEVAEETGISKKSIMYLLKEERLVVGDKDGDGDGFLTCEACKKPIPTGRMCKSCKKEVMSALQESVGHVVMPKRKPGVVEEKSIKGMAKLQLKGK